MALDCTYLPPQKKISNCALLKLSKYFPFIAKFSYATKKNHTYLSQRSWTPQKKLLNFCQGIAFTSQGTVRINKTVVTASLNQARSRQNVANSCPINIPLIDQQWNSSAEPQDLLPSYYSSKILYFLLITRIPKTLQQNLSYTLQLLKPIPPVKSQES